MKHIGKLTIILAIIFLSGINSFGQEIKLGHLNTQEILMKIPAMANVQAEIDSLSKKYEVLSKKMEMELETKYNEYLSGRDKMDDLIKATAEKDIETLQEKISNFNKMALESLQKKETELVTPIIQSLNEAIAQVGNENNFTYIFDIANRSIVYTGVNSIDVTNLVKAKLNVPIEK